MPTYTPDPLDENTPSDARAQGRSHAELRALKNRTNNLETALELADQNLEGLIDSEAQTRASEDDQLSQSINSVDGSLTQHKDATGNVHSLTPADIDLDNVPNTLFLDYTDYFDAQDPTKSVANGIANAKSIGSLAHALIEYINEKSKATLEDVFPVGSIIVINQSTVEFDPNYDSRYDFGTWQRLDDFYLKSQKSLSDSVGDTIGAHAKQIHTNNLPSHDHPATVNDPGHSHSATVQAGNQTSNVGFQASSRSNFGTANTHGSATGISVSIGNRGGNADFNVQPRSKVVAMWERTA